MRIFNLIVGLGIDGKGFRAGLEQAVSNASNFANRIKRELGFEGIMWRTAKHLLSFLMPLQMWFQFRQITEWASSLSDLSVKTGISVTRLQELEYVAMQTGVSLDEFGKYFSNLQKNISKAISGSKRLQEAFKSLGYEINDLKGKDIYTIGIDILKMASLSPESMLAPLSIVGGNTAVNLLQVANQDIDSLINNFRLLGATIDEKVVKGLDQMSDLIKDITVSAKYMIGYVAGAFVDLVKSGQYYFSKLYNTIIKLMPKSLRGPVEPYDFWEGEFQKAIPVSKEEREKARRRVEEEEYFNEMNEYQKRRNEQMKKEKDLSEQLKKLRFDLMTDEEKKLYLQKELNRWIEEYNNINDEIRDTDYGRLREMEAEIKILETSKQLMDIENRKKGLNKIRMDTEKDTLSRIGAFVTTRNDNQQVNLTKRIMFILQNGVKVKIKEE